MFALDVMRLFVVLLSIYIMSILYKGYLPIDGHLSDWTTMLLYNKKEVIICYIGLLIIFFIILNLFKNLALIFLNNKKYLYEKWKGIILLFLIIAVVSYLILDLRYFVIPPLFSFLFIKIVMKSE